MTFGKPTLLYWLLANPLTIFESRLTHSVFNCGQTHSLGLLTPLTLGWLTMQPTHSLTLVLTFGQPTHSLTLGAEWLSNPGANSVSLSSTLSWDWHNLPQQWSAGFTSRRFTGCLKQCAVRDPTSVLPLYSLTAMFQSTVCAGAPKHTPM